MPDSFSLNAMISTTSSYDETTHVKYVGAFSRPPAGSAIKLSGQLFEDGRERSIVARVKVWPWPCGAYTRQHVAGFGRRWPSHFGKCYSPRAPNILGSPEKGGSTMIPTAQF